MSRRTIAVVVVFLGALVIANIVVLAIWLPKRKSVTAQLATAPAVPGNPSPGASPIATSARSTVPAGDLVSKRQVSSTSGNLRIKYLRDRKSKMRRIVVEDARRPEANAVLCESKRTAWVLVSPDDQWIAVDERNATDGGGVRLYHRKSDSSVQFVLAEDGAPQGRGLQDAVWQTYLKATHADSNTPRRGVTIDATAWENDSRKLNISVAYLPAPDNPDVPEPWSCTYDVASKQVEPTPDQPTVGPEMASASTANQDGNQSDAEPSEQEGAADNPFSDSAPNSETDEAEVAESDEYPGEKFPATRLDELAVPDVNESSLSDITYAINEMFARHGAEFKDKKATKQFSEFQWYKPRPGLTFDDIEKEFSDLEKENLKVLGRCRDAKLATAHRKSRPSRGERAHEEPTGEQITRRILQGLGAPIPP